VVANTSVNIAGDGATVTGIKDEDNMASNSATKLATQQSIKAYVDAQVGTVDTLSEVLAIGNTTGATDIDVDGAQKVQFRDAAIYINSSVDGQLDIVADTEIQIAATTVDINGTVDVSGTVTATGTSVFASLDISGDIDVDGTTNLDVVDIDGAVDMASTLTVATKVFTPFIGSASDTDTNIYFPASNQMRVLNGGVETFRTLADGSVFNEGGVDADFRVESDTNANALIVDAGLSHVGINRAANSVVALSINSTATNSSTYALEACDSSSATKFHVRSDGHSVFYKTGNAFGFVHNTDGGITTTPDAGGHAVFNESGIDADFRVESDNEANMFVVNGGTDQVIITNSVQDDASPNYKDSLVLHNSQDGGSRILFSNGVAAELASIEGGIQGVGSDTDDGTLVFRTAKDATASEKMRIKNSGVVFNEDGLDLDFRVESDTNAHGFFLDAATTSVGINHTSTPGGYAQFAVRFSGSDANVNTTGVAIQDSGTNSNISFCTFFNSTGAGIGSITRVGTTNAVAYNTTSDRRAKENIADADDAGAVIDAIQVRKFDWIEGNQHQPYGMVAQELITVAPEAVHQPANEEDMMGVDYSKLVPMMLKEIQTLRLRITALENA
jgi:hypothetical protein